MTNEQAIKWLKAYIQDTPFQMEQYERAFEMAIKALSQEPTDKPMTVDEMEREYEKSKALIHKIVECDDAISRILKRMWNCRGKHTTSIDKVAMEQIIRDELSSVTSKPIECDDTVSRDAVLDAIRRISLGQTDAIKVSMMLEEYIKHLPSVTHKSGKWIRWREEVQRGTHCTENIPHCKCSECDTEYDIFASRFINYCPHCGAYMKGEP